MKKEIEINCDDLTTMVRLTTNGTVIKTPLGHIKDLLDKSFMEAKMDGRCAEASWSSCNESVKTKQQ